MKIETGILINGIKIVHQQVNSPVAHFGVLFNTGSRDELIEEQGLAHFYEHLIFKGTKRRKTHHILNRIEDVGGEINAYTTKEETAVYTSFLSEYYSRSMELISDIIKNSTFPENEIEREKEVIIEEINSYKDSPAELIFDDFEDLLFKDHPIGRNILGNPEQIKNYSRNDILRFIQNNYSTEEMVISSVGNISYKRLCNLANKYFGDIATKNRSNQRVAFSKYNPCNQRIKRDTYQSHCVIGNLAYDAQSDKRIAMFLLNSILGGQSMNSKLNLSLRERNGLAYNIESNFTNYSDTGVFNVYFGTEKENLDRAIKLVYKEFKILREKSLSSLQLTKAKRRLLGQMAMGSESRDDLMLAIGKSLMLYERIDSFEKISKEVEEITASNILEVANEILQTDKLTTLIYE